MVKTPKVEAVNAPAESRSAKAMLAPTLLSINADVRKTEAELQARREALVRPFLDAVAKDIYVGGEDVVRRLAQTIYPLMKGAPTAGHKPKPLRAPLPQPDQKVA